MRASLRLSYQCVRDPAQQFLRERNSVLHTHTMVGNPHLAGVAGPPRCVGCNMILSNGRCVYGCASGAAPAVSDAPQTASASHLEPAPQDARPALEPPPNLARLHARKVEMQCSMERAGLPDAVAACALPSSPSETSPAQSADCSSAHSGRVSPRASAQRSAVSSARSVRAAADAPPQSGLEAMELDVGTCLALEQVIRSMDPEWSRLGIAAQAKRGPRSYVINVRGQGEHHCLNKSCAHWAQ